MRLLRRPNVKEQLEAENRAYLADKLQRKAFRSIGNLAWQEHVRRCRLARVAALVQKAAGLGNIPRIERGKQP